MVSTKPQGPIAAPHKNSKVAKVAMEREEELDVAVLRL
jgi:hypothetical protein